MATEYSWLVENGRQGDELRYRWMDEMGVHWTPDPHRALRFSRRADAEAFASGDEDAWCIRQHGFEVGEGHCPWRQHSTTAFEAGGTMSLKTTEKPNKAPPKTDLDRVNDLINWYEKFKPDAGKQIQVNVGPRQLAKMLGIEIEKDKAGKEIVPPSVQPYRGRALIAVGSPHK